LAILTVPDLVPALFAHGRYAVLLILIRSSAIVTSGRDASRLAAVLLVTNLGGWLRPEEPKPVTRYGLALQPDQQLIDAFHPTFALAPDASWIV